VDGAVGGPAVDPLPQGVGVGRVVDEQDLDAELAEPAGERGGDAAPVRHQQHSAAVAEGDAGRPAQLQRWPQHRHGHPPRHPVGGLQVARHRRG